MYEYLEGRVEARKASRLVLAVGGVGYDLLIPLGTPFPEPAQNAGDVRVWTHLAVREDAHTLYGFPDRPLRDLFRVLLQVRGVGPAMALGVLSGLGRDELIQAVVNDDLVRLTRVKGVGKKTAEQILLDLRDKVASMIDKGGLPSNTPADAPPPLDANLEDAILALVSVGYSERDAKRQVERAAQKVDAKDLDNLVRAALKA